MITSRKTFTCPHGVVEIGLIDCPEERTNKIEYTFNRSLRYGPFILTTLNDEVGIGHIFLPETKTFDDLMRNLKHRRKLHVEFDQKHGLLSELIELEDQINKILFKKISVSTLSLVVKAAESKPAAAPAVEPQASPAKKVIS